MFQKIIIIFIKDSFMEGKIMKYRNRSSDHFTENRTRLTTAAAGSRISRKAQRAGGAVGSAHTMAAKGFNTCTGTVADAPGSYLDVWLRVLCFNTCTGTVADALNAGRAAAVERFNHWSQATASGGRCGVAGAAAGVGAHNLLSGFAENLDWSTVNPAKYMRAGTRGTLRSMDEARRVWESIPESLRALGDGEVLKRLRGFDWSHIRPHSQGGSSAASNGVFEAAGLNRSRGAEFMTNAEIEAARKALSSLAFRASCAKVATSAFKGGRRGAGIACALAVFEHLLEYQQGEISQDEVCRRIIIDVNKSALTGAAIAGVTATMAMASPGLIPVAASPEAQCESSPCGML